MEEVSGGAAVSRFAEQTGRPLERERTAESRLSNFLFRKEEKFINLELDAMKQQRLKTQEEFPEYSTPINEEQLADIENKNLFELRLRNEYRRRGRESNSGFSQRNIFIPPLEEDPNFREIEGIIKEDLDASE